jgi:TetR/AcrR family transcriptional regulator, tetracycline repressor protein
MPTEGKRTRPRLTVAVITAAALEIVRRTGVDGLTMRALAEALDVDVAATYRHVADKQALLELVLDHVLDEVKISEDTSIPPLDRLADLTRTSFDQVLRHPGSGSIVLRVGGHTAQTRRLSRASRALLMEAGFDEATAKRIEETRHRLWLGSVIVATAATREPRPAHQRRRSMDELNFAIQLVDAGMRALLQKQAGAKTNPRS